MSSDAWPDDGDIRYPDPSPTPEQPPVRVVLEISPDDLLALLRSTPAKDAKRGPKLTADAVLNIRRRAAQGESKSALSREYGTTVDTIRDIAAGRTWRNLT